jgi:hypothetical protein
MPEDHDAADVGTESLDGQLSSMGPCIAHGGMMKFILWAPVVIFALLSLRATVFVVYQGVSGSPFGEEEITVAGVGLVCSWIAWVMYKTLIRPWRKPKP